MEEKIGAGRKRVSAGLGDQVGDANSFRNVLQTSWRPPLPDKHLQKMSLWEREKEKGPVSFTIPSTAAAAPKLQILTSSSLRLLAEVTGSYWEEGGCGSNWAEMLILECAKAIAANESSRVQRLMWVLNELASSYGDFQQRLAAYMLLALFCKLTDSGPRCYHILCATAARTYSFDSNRKMILKYQEGSPWTTFGHVAANGALLEAFEGEMHVHVVDLSSTFCTQWPTLLELLATRPEGAPHFRLTSVIASPDKDDSAIKVMRQVGARMEKFARLMGVPFRFSVLVPEELEKLDASELNLRQGEALAINCVQLLHRVAPGSPRDALFATMRSMEPKIVTFVDEEVDLCSCPVSFPIAVPGCASPDCGGKLQGFREALRFYSLLFQSLEESLPRVSDERLMIERTCGRSIVNMVACGEGERRFWQEKAGQWSVRLCGAGFEALPFNDDVVDDVRALLKRYKEGWGLAKGQANHPPQSSLLYLTWKEQLTTFASAWKPVRRKDKEDAE